MKKMFSVMILSICLLFAAFTVTAGAMDQCEVVGNSYTTVFDGEEYTLSFTEAGPFFSPAPMCGGTVIFADAYNTGKIYDWTVTYNGLTVEGYPAVLTNNGLILYGIPTDLHSLRIGGTVYMTEQEVPLLLFK